MTSLTGTFVRLKLSLLRNGLRQSSKRTAAYVTSGVLALLFAAAQLLGLVLLRGSEQAPVVVVLLTALVAVGWAVVPLLFPSGDETLDPTRLVMLPLRPRPLVRALLVASLVGIGPLFTLCLVLGSAIALAHGPAGVVAAVLAVPLALVVCVAAARAVAAGNVRLLTSRRGRDLAVLSGLVVAVGVQFVNFGFQRLSRAGGLDALEPVAEIVRWLPPASALGAVDSASHGAYGTAAAQLLLTAAALGALLAAWGRSLHRLMTAPDGSTLAALSAPAGGTSKAASKAASGSGRGPGAESRWWPAGRTGTVMRRSLQYMVRDPKTKAALISWLLVGLIVPLVNAFQGTGSIYLACFSAGMLGAQTYNQFGQDGDAFWMVSLTISTAQDAYVELRARAYALLLIALPFTAVVNVATAATLGDWRSLPDAVGLSLGLLGAMFATGAVASYRAPYTVPQGSGFKSAAPGQAGIVWMSIFGGMAAAAALCAPLIGLTVWVNVADAPAGSAARFLVLVAGAGYGLLLGWAGLRFAAPRTAARLPEILAAVSKG
ncbi:transporter [Streptomyces solincola]|uniref:Transporter n=1 Tax=Streptomyces solincola TaxID=2100817 RepID=A0A2S9PNZ9_9ACTN|nr:transporter [Streptomyces solincola]PRH76158.1 transporter [Streptomyces solincola]